MDGWWSCKVWMMNVDSLHFIFDIELVFVQFPRFRWSTKIRVSMTDNQTSMYYLILNHCLPTFFLDWDGRWWDNIEKMDSCSDSSILAQVVEPLNHRSPPEEETKTNKDRTKNKDPIKTLIRPFVLVFVQFPRFRWSTKISVRDGLIRRLCTIWFCTTASPLFS